jgi:hypothetical protein
MSITTINNNNINISLFHENFSLQILVIFTKAITSSPIYEYRHIELMRICVIRSVVIQMSQYTVPHCLKYSPLGVLHLKYPYQYTKFCDTIIFDCYYKSNLKFHILNSSSTFRIEIVPGVF